MATLAFFKQLFTPMEGSPEQSRDKYQLLHDSKCRHLEIPSEAINVLCDTINTLNLIQSQTQQHSLETETPKNRLVLRCFESSSTSGTSLGEESSSDQKNSSNDPLGEGSSACANLDGPFLGNGVNSSFTDEEVTAKLCNGLNDSTVSESYDSAIIKQCDKENESTNTQNVSYARSCNSSLSESKLFSADSDDNLDSSYLHSSMIQSPPAIPKASTDESLLSSMKGATPQSSIVSDECASAKKALKKKAIQLAAVFGSCGNTPYQSVSSTPCSASIKGHQHSTPVHSKLAISFQLNALDDASYSATVKSNGDIHVTTPTATPTPLPILAQFVQQQLKATEGKIDKLKNVLKTDDDDLIEFDIEERLSETELAIEDHLKYLTESSWFKFAKEAALVNTHDMINEEMCDLLLKKMQLNALKAEQSSLHSIYNLYI